MVIGSGALSEKFNKYCDDNQIIIFADGVIHSTENNKLKYDEEFDSVRRFAGCSPLFVYFSSCSIFDSEERSSLYVEHKMRMEQYITDHFDNYLIFRKSQLIGDLSDKTNILNYLMNRIKSGNQVNVWVHAYRNLLDIDHFAMIVCELIEKGCFRNSIVNVANPYNISVVDIVSTLEKFLQKEASINNVERGTEYFIDIGNIIPVIEKLGIEFNNNYFNGLLTKYYGWYA